MLNSDIDKIIQGTNLAQEITNLPILITGGTGFIGSWLVTALNKMAVDKKINNPIYILTTDKARAANIFYDLQIKKILIVTILELQDQFSSGSLKGFGYVFHCATATILDQNDKNNNFNQTIDFAIKVLNILQFSNTTPNFINLSSGAVYGLPTTNIKFSEDNSQRNYNSTLTLYGKTKVTIEELIIKADRDGIIKGSNPRLFTFYGQGLPLNSHFAIGNFINDAINKGKIEISGSLETIRSYLYITDLIIQLFSVVTKPTLDVLHIGSGFATTIGELASKVSKNFDNCPIIVTNQNINPNFYIPEVIKTSRYLCATETISLDIGLPRWKQSLMKKPIN